MGTKKHMTAAEKQERRVHLERRIQSVMLAIATGFVVWAVPAFVGALGKIERIDERTEAQSVQIGLMYTARDAERDMHVLGARIDGNTARVESLESRVGAVEDQTARLLRRDATP